MPTVLKDKKIAILGLGIENEALLGWIIKHDIPCEITICDKRNEKELGERFSVLKGSKKDKGRRGVDMKWKLGSGFDRGLENFDILFRSPGWPISCPGIKEVLKKKRAILSSPMRLFFELCPTKNTIGVTGTKGKGTTASLIYEILKVNSQKSKVKSFLGGNIGVAPFTFLDEIKKDDFVVLELSSFQLEDFKVSPHIAVITNLYPEHLSAADPMNPNFHKSIAEYWRAKSNIIKWQKRGDVAIINDSLKGRMKKEKRSGKVLFYSKSSLRSQLIGEHNKQNIAAAEAVAKTLKISPAVVRDAVSRFAGLPYRLQKVYEKDGVVYYNDSFATTPEASIIALDSFAKNKIILLAGGADKGADFKEFAKKIKQRVKYLILFAGQGTDRLIKELVKARFDGDKFRLATSMEEALPVARKYAEPGDAIVLSTGCASFGIFKNYKERGRLFDQEAKR